jgi:hypothetical protein
VPVRVPVPSGVGTARDDAAQATRAAPGGPGGARVNRIPHDPIRPVWLCRACAQPWPCGAARLELVRDYRTAVLGLYAYLAACLNEAREDLLDLAPNVAQPDLWPRFMGWPPTRRRR